MSVDLIEAPAIEVEMTAYSPTAEGLDAEISAVPAPGGWSPVSRARLPEDGYDAGVGLVCASKVDALIAACEGLIAWCSTQKENGGKRHRRQAQALQDWALGVEKSLRPVSAEPAAPAVPHQSPAAPEGLRLIAIDELYESPWNPRKHFPEAAMAEITESMRTSGFRDWLPLLVRPLGVHQYEIGAGHRRSRAARAAGITMIPCIVRPMSDEEFLDVLNFDNTGREDVHRLEEAAGWRHLMETTGKTVVEIAARIGKSKEYVYEGLKYDALIPSVKEAFLEKRITPGHAILIARLDTGHQQLGLKNCFDWQGNLVSVREFGRWVQRTFKGADLEHAPFDRADAGLVPAAGSCAECSKAQGDVCLDSICFEGKVQAHVAAKTASGLIAVSAAYNNTAPPGVLVEAEYAEIYTRDPEDEEEFEEQEEGSAPPEDEPGCRFAEDAVVAHGDDSRLGKTIRICRNPACPEHGSRLRGRGEGGSGGGKKYLWAERAAALPAKIKLASRRALLDAVLRKAGRQELTYGVLQLIAEALVPNSVPPELFQSFRFAWGEKLKSANGGVLAEELLKVIRSPKGSPNADDLPRVLLGLALLETAKEYCYDSDSAVKRLHAAAGIFEVDAKQVAADVAYNLSEDFKWRRASAKAKKEGKAPPEMPVFRKVGEPEGGTRREVVGKLPTLSQSAPKKAAPKPAAKKAPAKKAAKPAPKKKGGKK